MGLKEVIVVGVVILLLFGGSILPRLARSSAKRMKESKDTLLATKTDQQHFSASGLGLASRLHTGVTPILWIATLILACAIAAVSYYVVELPFLRRKER